MIILLVLRLLATIILAFIIGKLVSLIKLPAILGWLLTGMIFGPYALGLINNELIASEWYKILINCLECSVGLLIGTELVFKKLKKNGSQIIITTLTQSIGTFIIVSLVFGITFYFMNIPLYLAVIFGSISLATAPAPALSIVREFKTDGPVTKTLIPMAALDDIVAVVIFFTTISIISANVSTQQMPIYMIFVIIFLPIVIGIVIGVIGGIILRKKTNTFITTLTVLFFISLCCIVAELFNYLLMPNPVLNFMIMGMAFSATFSNIVSEERLSQIMRGFSPILGISMIIVILNLGMPLNYKSILGAGLFTLLYIVSRAIGKYSGALFGATITKSPKAVKKYLGLTLLPHSGVSLIFTGIAVNMLSASAPESATIIQGTIAAAAIINEILAVILAKQAFKWAGELNKKL